MKEIAVHHKEGFVLNQTADVQQMLVIKTEVPWSSSMDQQDPELLHIKEEEEEMWSRQEEEQLHVQNETECAGILFSPVKSEEDEKPQLFQLHQIKTEDSRETEPPTCSSAEQIKTETDEEDCGGPEPDRNQDPNTYEKPLDSSETDDDYSWDHFTNPGPESESSLKLGRAPEFENDKNVTVEERTQVNLTRAEGPQTAGKTFSCSFCSKTFKGCGSLINHIRGHTGEKPFECKICGKKFRLNCLLKYHFSIHTGEKPFQCGICDRRFKLKWVLKNHFRIHTGEKPFECESCGKKFRHMTGLKSHIKTHTGEKPFECGICGRRFVHKAGLKDHTRGHRVGQTFECEYCDKKLDHETFNDHMMDHKRKMPFSCNDCGKLFKLEFNFQRHLMGHRGEKSFDWDFFGENM